MSTRSKAPKNPAWRPASAHTNTLASIGHLLLGEDPACAPGSPEETGRVLPVLCALTGQNARAECSATLQELESALHRTDGDEPRWVVRAASATPSADELAGPVLLVLAHANLESIRQAYLHIKRCTRHARPRIGVVLRGTEQEAQRCYEHLALGAARFLALDLIELGFISNEDPGAQLELLAGLIKSLWQASED